MVFDPTRWEELDRTIANHVATVDELNRVLAEELWNLFQIVNPQEIVRGELRAYIRGVNDALLRMRCYQGLPTRYKDLLGTIPVIMDSTLHLIQGLEDLRNASAVMGELHVQLVDIQVLWSAAMQLEWIFEAEYPHEI